MKGPKSDESSWDLIQSRPRHETREPWEPTGMWFPGGVLTISKIATMSSILWSFGERPRCYVLAAPARRPLTSCSRLALGANTY